MNCLLVGFVEEVVVYLEISLLLVLDGGEELLVGEGRGGGGEGSSSCFLVGRRFGGLMSGLLLLTVVS